MMTYLCRVCGFILCVLTILVLLESAAFGYSLTVNDDATMIQEIWWGWSNNHGNTTLNNWVSRIGAQDTSKVNFAWEGANLEISIFTNQSTSPYQYDRNYGMSYDLLEAIGYNVPAEWETNGVPGEYSNNDLGEYLMAADFFIALDRNGTWDTSVVLQDHSYMAPNDRMISLWGAERMSTLANHQYDNLPVGLYSVDSWLKPYYVSLDGPGGGENYDKDDPKVIPVITQYGTDKGIPITVNVTTLQNPIYTEYFFKDGVETYGFSPYLRDQNSNIVYDADGYPLFTIVTSYDWNYYKQDMGDYYFDKYGIFWDVPDNISNLPMTNRGQYKWDIVISGGNQSEEWRNFNFFFGTGTCGNDIIIGTATNPVPEPATMILTGMGFLGFWFRHKRKK